MKTVKVCSICNNPYDKTLNKDFLNKEALNKKIKIEKKGICEKCSEVIKEDVTLSCDGCDSITVIGIEKMRKYMECEKGDMFNIFRCPKCSVDGGFHFTNKTIIK